MQILEEKLLAQISSHGRQVVDYVKEMRASSILFFKWLSRQRDHSNTNDSSSVSIEEAVSDLSALALSLCRSSSLSWTCSISAEYTGMVCLVRLRWNWLKWSLHLSNSLIHISHTCDTKFWMLIYCKSVGRLLTLRYPQRKQYDAYC